MKRSFWILPVILASTYVAPVALTQAYPVHIAQVASDYNKYMRTGYKAVANRDYRSALTNFRRALQIRPGDRYATNAANNVSNYLARVRQFSVSLLPSGLGAPSARIGGATRGRACFSGKTLMALAPENQLGLTTAEYPVIFFYIPKTSAQTLEFTLNDASNNKNYETKVAVPQTPGIARLDLSDLKDLPPLEIGKNYQWSLSLVCDPEDASANIFVDGSLQRIQLDPVLASELEQSKPRDRVSLYAVNRIWFDTLAAMFEARQSSPNDSVLADEWADLLKSAGLDQIAAEPFVQCCTVKRE